MKRFLSILLSVAMVVAVLSFVACGEETPATTTTAAKPVSTTTAGQNDTPASTTTAGGNDTPASTTTAGGNEPVVTTTVAGGTDTPVTPPSGGLDGKSKHPDFMDVNFGGKTFTFAIMHDGDWDPYEIYAEATGDDSLIVEGVIERNAIVESLYSCKIVEVQTDAPSTLVSNDIATGTCNYEFAMVEYGNASAGSNWLNIAKLDIDLSNSWWNQSFNNCFSVYNDGVQKLYTISGEFNLLTYDATWALFFNKNVYETLVSTGKTSIDLYQTVRDGKWTLDVMAELINAVKSDVDGDQQMTYANGDVFGLTYVSNGYPERNFYFGIGGRAALIDETTGNAVAISNSNFDIAALSAGIDKAHDVIENDGCAALGISDTQASLTNGQSLFVSECLQVAQRITDEDAYFSIVPQPKANEEQESYAAFSCNRGYGIKVSAAVADTTSVANFLEVFGFHSEMILYPAYINYYKTQCFCEEESGEMLEITLQSIVFDLDCFADGGLVTAFSPYISKGGKNMLTKAIASKSNAANSYYNSRVDTYAQYN